MEIDSNTYCGVRVTTIGIGYAKLQNFAKDLACLLGQKGEVYFRFEVKVFRFSFFLSLYLGVRAFFTPHST